MSQKFYFNGLNEIRAIAALCVVFHHIELYCAQGKGSSLFHHHFFQYFIGSIGKNGVYMFFVLSGFLITYLLLKEKAEHSDVDIPKFYFRRIFRIWPLYFIIIIISVVILPVVVSNTNFFESETFFIKRLENADNYSTNNIWLYVLLLSNFALPIVGAAQTWSVSVEEQFYLVWPHLVKRFSRQHLLWVFIVLFVGKIGYQILRLPYYEYLKLIPLEIMAIGGVFAYFWFYNKEMAEKYSKNNFLYIINLLVVAAGFLFPIPRMIVAVFFAFTILFVITERRWNLRNKTLFFLGTISYGIYMYHPLMMFLSSAISHKFFADSNPFYKVLFYILTVGLTIITSYLSYHFIEKKLINFKDRKFSNTK